MTPKVHNTKRKKTNPIFNMHIHMIDYSMATNAYMIYNFLKYSNYAYNLIYPHHFLTT